MLVENILKIKNSESYIKYHKYHQGNIFGITKTSRLEHMHSNFIGWIFDSKMNCSLGIKPITKLLNLILVAKEREINKDARIDKAILYNSIDDNYILSSKSKREVTFIMGSKKRSIDIIVEVFLTDNKILPIIFENKVDSSEHTNQTAAYFGWAEDNYKDLNKYHKPIYIYLTPEYNNSLPTCKEFLNLKYQDLVDFIIDPSLRECDELIIKNNIRMYLQSLSFQIESEKGDNIMAISCEEKKILDDFIKENKTMLCAVLNELKGDEDIDSNAVSSITSAIKDYSKYIFEGNEYGKGRLVLAVVKKYVSEHPNISYNELANIFKPELRKAKNGKGVIALQNEVSDKDKGIGANSHRRYFVNDEIPLTDGSIVLVSTEWGSGNIDPFLDYARNVLKYKIENA